MTQATAIIIDIASANRVSTPEPDLDRLTADTSPNPAIGRSSVAARDSGPIKISQAPATGGGALDRSACTMLYRRGPVHHGKSVHPAANKMDLKEASLIEGDIAAHWYYRAKLAAVRTMLDRIPVSKILDVGAGIGFFSRELLNTSDASAATCVDLGYDREHEEQANGKPLHFCRGIARSDADLVLMMDVLEHVPDDVGLLREYTGKVARGTYFLMTVPAFKVLWSDHDVFLEHFRRYTLTGIEQATRAAGLQVERGCYFYGGLFPLVAVSRLAAGLRGRGKHKPQSQMRKFNPLLNAAFWQVCRAELSIMRNNRLAGLTAFVLAAKR